MTPLKQVVSENEGNRLLYILPRDKSFYWTMWIFIKAPYQKPWPRELLNHFFLRPLIFNIKWTSMCKKLPTNEKAPYFELSTFSCEKEGLGYVLFQDLQNFCTIPRDITQAPSSLLALVVASILDHGSQSATNFASAL